MRVTLSEDPNGFWIVLEAEDNEDTRKLVRYGLNHTKKLKYCEVFVPQHSPAILQMSIGRRKINAGIVAFTS